ncbi:ATP-grasp domain-containing protein [Streptomyces sp. NPDC050704]|uniref:ATP-grasp domain-containing protein n=1 Tax=Streptomyces sp. NPDC050704 TaxID=3157219 RepID=UPI00341FF3A2
MNELEGLPAGPDAFILLGGFGVVCRNPLYLAELKARNLRILLITPGKWRDEALACIRDKDHPASAIDDIAFVDGSMQDEGSFTAGVIARAQQWRTRYSVVGVYAVGEILVEQTGILADALGLASPGVRATKVCRSKYLQRWYLDEWSPHSTVVPAAERQSVDPAAIPLPAVVKPAGRHSSSGVVTVTSAGELGELLDSYPATENLLIEEKVVGQEFSVETLVQRGRAVFSSVTKKETTESSSRTFVELSHSVPSALSDEEKLLLTANDKMLEQLEFSDGIAHAEWRVTSDRRPRLMEVAARTPGDGLLVLYQLATGVPLEPEIIKVALQEPASYPKPHRFTRQVYLEHTAGVLEDVEFDWPGVGLQWLGESGLWPHIAPGAPDDPATVRAVFVLKDRGSTLGPLRDSDDRAVTFFIDAPSPEELDELEQAVRQALHIHISPA